MTNDPNPKTPTDARTLQSMILRVLEMSRENMNRYSDRQWVENEVKRFKAFLQGYRGMLEAGEKNTGITRNVDELGRLVIPKEIRNTLDIPNGTPLEIFLDDKENKIVFKVYAPTCHFCGDSEDLYDFKDKLICEQCIGELFHRV